MFIIEHAIERSKAEILEDMSTGVVPPTVCRFYQLHDYVDANEYGGLCESGTWWMLADDVPDEILELTNEGLSIIHTDQSNAVQNAVDAWLQELNPEQAKYEAEQDAIDPLHSWRMYRGQPLGPGPHDPIKWCSDNCPRCESEWVSKMELAADVQ